MSIQRKFLIAITVVIAAFAVVIAFITSISASSEAEDKISQQKEQLSARLTNILTVTDSLMHERVVSSMKLLKERLKTDTAKPPRLRTKIQGDLAD